ncbi:hypothetical protein RB195_009351 [Necator americanus]|uniref:Uncharacterized protein n=1 Tax=Necator americanus TaxID=51031 RepID=A0ABR1CUU4_NECAM
MNAATDDDDNGDVDDDDVVAMGTYERRVEMKNPMFDMTHSRDYEQRPLADALARTRCHSISLGPPPPPGLRARMRGPAQQRGLRKEKQAAATVAATVGGRQPAAAGAEQGGAAAEAAGAEAQPTANGHSRRAAGRPAGLPSRPRPAPPLLNDIAIDFSEIALFTKLDEGKQRKHKEKKKRGPQYVEKTRQFVPRKR